MVPIELDEIRARLAAATPGPWAWESETEIIHTSTYSWQPYPCMWIRPNDAALIAHAPADLAYLLDRIDAQAAELAALRAAVRAAEKDLALVTGADTPSAGAIMMSTRWTLADALKRTTPNGGYGRALLGAVDILRRLVVLKDGPRDANYEDEKPQAWAYARRVLADIDAAGRGDPR